MKSRDAFNVLVGFPFLSAVAVGLFLLIHWMVERFSTLESQTSSAIVAGVAAVLVAAMSHLYQGLWNRRRAIEEAQRPAKIELYQEFISNFFDVMNVERQDTAQSHHACRQAKLEERQQKITQKMILWGSDDVISAYGRWWRIAQQAGDDSHQDELFARLEDMLLAFRRDLGHKNRDLDRKEILSLVFDDIEKLDFSKYPLKPAKGQRRRKRPASERPSEVEDTS